MDTVRRSRRRGVSARWVGALVVAAAVVLVGAGSVAAASPAPKVGGVCASGPGATATVTYQGAKRQVECQTAAVGKGFVWHLGCTKAGATSTLMYGGAKRKTWCQQWGSGLHWVPKQPAVTGGTSKAATGGTSKPAAVAAGGSGVGSSSGTKAGNSAPAVGAACTNAGTTATVAHEGVKRQVACQALASGTGFVWHLGCTESGAISMVMYDGAQRKVWCQTWGSGLYWVPKPQGGASEPGAPAAAAVSPGVVKWVQDGVKYWSTGTPPACGSLTWTFPLENLNQVEYVLYPGQVRGGDYKAHGGFRTRTESIRVTSPISGYMVEGSRSPEEGVVQVWIEIHHPCGFGVKLDHLRVLSPALQEVFDRYIPVGSDSRGTELATPFKVEAGDLLATVIGAPGNWFFDFGVYDMRSIQRSRRSEAELRAFGPSGMRGLYGVCWFSLFGSALEAQIRALPPSGGDSRTDYC